MTTARIWARKRGTYTHRDDSTYEVSERAYEAPRRIVTRDNAAAFALKRELNR